jgi:hypothetical protein
LSYIAAAGLEGMKRSTLGIVPVAADGTAALGGSSVRHMTSEFTAEFSTVLPPTWLMRPVLAQHSAAINPKIAARDKNLRASCRHDDWRLRT